MNKIGMYASLACAVHCAVFPLLLVFAPSLADWLHLNVAVEAVLLVFVVGVTGYMMMRGFPVHRRLKPSVVAVLGVLCLLLGVMTHGVHEAHDHAGVHWDAHTSWMVVGGLFLFIAQYWNARLLRRCPSTFK